MNKSDLIVALAQKIGVTHREAGFVARTAFDAMAEALANGGNIEIRGFGSFVVKEYFPYQGRNPKTGEKIEVPPKRLPFFKVGKELRERVDSEDSSD